MCSPSCRPLPSVRLNPSLLHYTTLGWQLHLQITLPVASPSHSLLSRIHSHPSPSPYMFPLRGHSDIPLLRHCSSPTCSPSSRPLPSVRLNPSPLHYTSLG